jgi:uncharacterized membrane protein YeaQ/YmgE (transglycosylase-associated protein family)
VGGIVIFILVALVVLFVLSALLNVVFDLFIPVLVWGIIGWLAGKLMRGQGYGILGNIVLGLVGGVIGSVLFGLLGVGIGGIIGNIIAGVVGAVVVVFLVRTFSENKSFGR